MTNYLILYEQISFNAYIKNKGVNFYLFDLRFGKMDKNSNRGYWFSEDLIVPYGDNFELICSLIQSQDYNNYLIAKEILKYEKERI